jgi:excisionase family DNA binding protein
MAATSELADDLLDQILHRLDRMEATLDHLAQQKLVKDWYTTEEIAEMLGRSDYTVREWCRLGRISAEKKGSGRGKYQSWVVSHDELQRYQREGLLPAKH